MSEKRYQISPVELVRWAEPLVFDEGEAEGFSEEVIASYETAAGVCLPAAFRSYLLACGQAGLNSTQHEMFVPDRNAEPFQHRLTFSYDYIKGDLKWFQEKGEKDDKELAKLRALPLPRRTLLPHLSGYGYQYFVCLWRTSQESSGVFEDYSGRIRNRIDYIENPDLLRGYWFV